MILYEGENMSIKEKVNQIKEQVAQLFDENKKILLIGMGVLVVTMLTLLNIHLFQMSYYTMKDDTEKVITILAKDVQKDFRQDDWYFQKGINYLSNTLEKEQSKAFLENNFKYLNEEIQKNIIKAYNSQALIFKQQMDVFTAITVSENTDDYAKYMKRVPIDEIEKGLKFYLTEAPKLTQDTVDKVYKIVSLQRNKLPLKLFKINAYELMSFPHNGDVNAASLRLLDFIEPEAIRKSLFDELKTKPIELDLFGMWVDVLYKKKIISTTEYASFTSSYGNIKRMQEQYKQVLLQEVDVYNIKQMIDVQTEEVVAKVGKLTKEIEVIDAQIQQDTETLNKLANYKEVELYVLDQYDNGDYEVAIPERSWLFGTYKPGNQRLRLKITASKVENQGVRSFDVYNKGKSQDGLPYYVEVSAEQKAEISALGKKINEARAIVVEKQKMIETHTQEIEHIRKTNNYDQTLLAIEEIDHKKANLEIEIKKEKLLIQNLFQIGELIVENKKQ